MEWVFSTAALMGPDALGFFTIFFLKSVFRAFACLLFETDSHSVALAALELIT